MAIELEDGTVVRSLPEQVDYLTTHNEENEIAIDNLAARLEAAIAGVLHYKGSVPTYADLPADAEIGDVYNVIDTGANYAWTGSEWDELGSSVDLSSLVDLTSVQTITGVKTFSNGIKTNSIEQTAGALKLGVAGNNIESNGSFIPILPDARELGSSANKWSTLYLSGQLKFTNTQYITGDSSSVRIRSDSVDVFFGESAGGVIPVTHGTYTPSLGNPSNMFKDLFLSGEISDGTNSVTVADLKALIDYAKAQGWIS